jgi:hypothetical protein
MAQTSFDLFLENVMNKFGNKKFDVSQHQFADLTPNLIVR